MTASARRSLLGAATAAVGASLFFAATASATFHLVLIREVYPGSTAKPNSEYVELQMYAAGQNLVSGHSVTIYDAAGSLVQTSTFSANAASGANQSTVLMATPEAEAQFGVAADGALAPGKLDPAGGAACWAGLDCVSWGAFSGSLPSPAGSPAAPGGIPDEMALRRTIAPNCPSLLEAADDRNNSALDFETVFPNPRPNSVPPSEHACSSSGGGGESPQTAGAPQTRLFRKPARRTRDRTPTFRFESSEPKSTFECSIDGGRFRVCRSPFTPRRRLHLGRHSFRVRARDAIGLVDPTPAGCAFRVVRRSG